MTATPRTIHARAITSTPRSRRVTGVTTRPFGAVSLFLAATAILGATSLLFLWQTGQATTTAFNIQSLSHRLADDQNEGALLESQAYGEKSSVQIMPAAISKYGMSLHNGDSQRTIDVPIPATIQTANTANTANTVFAPDSGTTASASVRLATTSATMTSWWQGLWDLLGGH